MNSTAKVPNSAANWTKFTSKVPNSIANRTKSTAQVTNSMAKTCMMLGSLYVDVSSPRCVVGVTDRQMAFQFIDTL